MKKLIMFVLVLMMIPTVGAELPSWTHGKSCGVATAGRGWYYDANASGTGFVYEHKYRPECAIGTRVRNTDEHARLLTTLEPFEGTVLRVVERKGIGNLILLYDNIKSETRWVDEYWCRFGKESKKEM